ncbi:MAG: hypothetical protein JWN24_1466 [Phycisphaerales bacterium]|nr:hypothetical protein [Phycisphaerales bacterium]
MWSGLHEYAVIDGTDRIRATDRSGDFGAGPCRPGRSEAPSYSLSLVLGGEGWGEGPYCELRDSQ